MTEPTAPADTRSRIIEVAARLLRDEGPGAVTTRGVAQGAGVQAPAIYRLFGDKDGLLEAVAEHVMAEFVVTKASVVDAATADDTDPVEDLRRGWHSQLAFGLGNPALFRLLSDPARVAGSPAARAGKRVLEARVHRVALAGRLAVTQPRAVGMIQASGIGAITTLLATPLDERDSGLAEAMLESVLAKILTDPPEPRDRSDLSTAVAFRAVAPDLQGLSRGERDLLVEWLDRVVARASE